MLHHTFDQDPDDLLRFELSVVYKNDDVLLAYLANPALGVYLEANAAMGADLSVEFSELLEIKLLKP